VITICAYPAKVELRITNERKISRIYLISLFECNIAKELGLFVRLFLFHLHFKTGTGLLGDILIKKYFDQMVSIRE